MACWTYLPRVWHAVTGHVPTPAPPQRKSDTTLQNVRADVRSEEHLLHRCAFAVASYNANGRILLSEESEFKQSNNDKSYQ